jgi:hypothetical protein
MLALDLLLVPQFQSRYSSNYGWASLDPVGAVALLSTVATCVLASRVRRRGSGRDVGRRVALAGASCLSALLTVRALVSVYENAFDDPGEALPSVFATFVLIVVMLVAAVVTLISLAWSRGNRANTVQPF